MVESLQLRAGCFMISRTVLSIAFCPPSSFSPPILSSVPGPYPRRGYFMLYAYARQRHHVSLFVVHLAGGVAGDQYCRPPFSPVRRRMLNPQADLTYTLPRSQTVLELLGCTMPRPGTCPGGWGGRAQGARGRAVATSDARTKPLPGRERESRGLASFLLTGPRA